LAEKEFGIKKKRRDPARETMRRRGLVKALRGGSGDVSSGKDLHREKKKKDHSREKKLDVVYF